MEGADLEKLHARDSEKRAPSDTGLSSDKLSDACLKENVTTAANDASGKHERSIHGIKWALAVTSILWVDFLFAMDNTIVSCLSLTTHARIDASLARKCSTEHHKHLW